MERPPRPSRGGRRADGRSPRSLPAAPHVPVLRAVRAPARSRPRPGNFPASPAKTATAPAAFLSSRAASRPAARRARRIPAGGERERTSLEPPRRSSTRRATEGERRDVVPQSRMPPGWIPDCPRPRPHARQRPARRALEREAIESPTTPTDERTSGGGDAAIGWHPRRRRRIRDDARRPSSRA